MNIKFVNRFADLLFATRAIVIINEISIIICLPKAIKLPLINMGTMIKTPKKANSLGSLDNITGIEIKKAIARNLSKYK